MKQIFLTIISIFSIFSAANAEVKEKVLEVKNFEEIVLNGSSKVIYTQGKTYSVRVKADESIIDCANAYSDGKTLSLSTRGKRDGNVNFGFFDLIRGIKNNTSEICFYVTSPDLTSVTLLGSGGFISKNPVDTDNLNLTLKGSGDIDFNDIICDQFSAFVLGSGDINVGKVESINSNLQVKGSGDVRVKQQKVISTELSVLGSGDITLHCTDCGEVNANVTGSGDINLSGQIKKLNKNVRGSGKIHY